MIKRTINGNLDIFAEERKENIDGSIETWTDILIHGDPNGLRSFAEILLNIADLNQDKMKNLPEGERAHIHLQSKFGLSKSSDEVIIGRLDAKGTGKFYERFIAK